MRLLVNYKLRYKLHYIYRANQSPGRVGCPKAGSVGVFSPIGSGLFPLMQDALTDTPGLNWGARGAYRYRSLTDRASATRVSRTGLRRRPGICGEGPHRAQLGHAELVEHRTGFYKYWEHSGLGVSSWHLDSAILVRFPGVARGIAAPWPLGTA